MYNNSGKRYLFACYACLSAAFEEGNVLKIDLTCPVELWQYAMPTDEHSECTFVMNNLSDKVVVSVQVTLSCYDQQDQLLFR